MTVQNAGAARNGVDDLIVEAVASGVATTRSRLSDLLGVAPSTVSARVNTLLQSKVLKEAGNAASLGGRRAQLLEVAGVHNSFGVIDLGGAHARYGIFSLQGELLRAWEESIDLNDPPELVLKECLNALRGGGEAIGLETCLKGMAIGLPAPINRQHNWIDAGTRMRGWARFPVRDWLQSEAKVPVVIENDANLLALGEARNHPDLRSSITVKAGRAIGSGIVVDGRLHRGASGMEGDITHVRVRQASGLPCACGNRGCLETVASGAALVEAARERDDKVRTLADVVERAQNGDSLATNLVRTAGSAIGQVLCGVVGFANPDAVFIGGRLSTVEVFIAAIRSEIYGGCHPFVTKNLRISKSAVGLDAGLYGGYEIIYQLIFPSVSRMKLNIPKD